MQNRRKKDLLSIYSDSKCFQNLIEPMIDDVVFLEGKLEELRELPFIRVNPKNPVEQKATPAAKQYKEFLQQYNNCIKILASILNRTEGEEESPLREWVNSQRGKR